MAAGTTASRAAGLLILVIASCCLADENDGRGKDARLHECQDFFYNLEEQLEDCADGLVARVGGAPSGNGTAPGCPQPCRRLLQDMKPYCGRQLEPVLRNSYGFSLLDSSGRPLDVCAAFCGSNIEQCTVGEALLPRLDALHQLHDYDSSLWTLAAKSNGDGGGNGASGSSGSGSGSDSDDSGEQQGNATAAWSPAAAPPADDGAGSGVNVGAAVAGAVVGSVALAAGGLALWRVRQARRRRRQPAEAGEAEPEGDGKPGSDLEAGWGADQDKGPAHKQQRQQRERADVDSAATSASDSPVAAAAAATAEAADAQDAAPDGLEGLAALWAQAAQAAAPSSAAPNAEVAGAAAAPAAARRQPHDTAYRGDQPRQADRHTDSAAQVAHSSAAAAAPASAELHAPSTPAGELQRGVSRRSSQGTSRTASAAMDLERWEVDFSALALVRLLGEGSAGSVYLATLRESSVAVKLLAGSDPAAASAGSWRSSPALEALHKESSVMAALRHPNVVLFLGISYEPPAIISEYCARGSLFDVLRSAAASEAVAASLTWPRRLRLALDAAKGMLALHSHQPPIIHRDLKSPNLLVDGAWRVKVADFNLSKLLEDTGVRSTSLGGMLNPRWLAPEVLTGGSATAASDTFSMGVVLWELMTWTIPWEDRNMFQLVHMVSGGERLAVPARQSVAGAAPDPELYEAYVALIRRCWAQRPEDRPGFAEIIQDLRAMMAYAVAPFDAAA